MNKFVWLLAGLAWIGSIGAGAAVEFPLDGYAALVNDRIVTKGDVAMMADTASRQLRLTHTGRELRARLKNIYAKALDSLIERALILEEAKRKELEVPEQGLEAEMNRVIAERFQGDRSRFLQALADEKMTIADYRDQTRDTLNSMLLRRQEVTERVVVTPAMVRALYEARLEEYRQPEQVKVSMIEIQAGATEADRVVKRARAAAVLARAAGGEDFALVAKDASEGMKAQEGGAWGWVKPGDFRAELAKAMESLKAGEISPVVETEETFYIIRLEARRTASVLPFEEVRTALAKEVRRAEEDRLYKEWIERLKSRHFVRILSDQFFPEDAQAGGE